jgi:hypothetical protein
VEQDVYTAQVSAAGTVSNERATGVGAPRQSQPRIARGGDVHMSVFLREVAEHSQIYAQRLDASGNPLDAEPFLVSSLTNRTNDNPSVAWNGSVFLVVWDRQETDQFGNTPRKVYGRRVSAAGALLDAAPFYVQEGLTPDVAALGDTFLSVAIYRQGSQTRWVQSVQVSGEGVVLGPVTLVSSAFNYAPRVAALGGRWLVVWEYHSRHDRSTSWTRGAFVETDGTVATAGTFQVAVSDSQFGSGNSYDDTPDLAVSGNEALIVWADGDNGTNNIKGRRIAADGTLLGSNFGFLISDAPGAQFHPSVTWNGTEYVVSWLDHRNEQFPTQPRGDIYAARVTPNDTVLDPAGFAVANSAAPGETPFVLGSNGTTLFAYSGYYDHAPYSAMRVALRRSSSSPAEGAIAVSRKMHGTTAGDVILPLTGAMGIEPRSGGSSGTHQIVVTFPAAVNVSEAQITSGVGSVMNMSVNGSQVTVNLAGVPNAQRLNLRLVNVNGAGNVDVPMGVLLGDTNRNESVNASDVGQTKAMSGQTVDATNFYADVNVSGSVNATDLGMVKAQAGTFLP